MNQKEKERLKSSVALPLLFTGVLWAIELLEVVFDFSLSFLGVFPRTLPGLVGILTGPLVHGDFSHLFSNTVPILLLGTALFYFYRSITGRVLMTIYLGTGLIVWAAARPSYHIGASGIIYGLVTFLFFSGIIRKHQQLLGLSLLVAFIYGGMTWGIFPGQPGVSWESHLFGAIVGGICAIYFRKEGPQKPQKRWEEDEDDDLSYWESIDRLKGGSRGGRLRYLYTPERDKNEDE